MPQAFPNEGEERTQEGKLRGVEGEISFEAAVRINELEAFLGVEPRDESLFSFFKVRVASRQQQAAAEINPVSHFMYR